MSETTDIRDNAGLRTAGRAGFATKLRKMVIWRSQVATRLAHLAIFGSLVAKPAARREAASGRLWNAVCYPLHSRVWVTVRARRVSDAEHGSPTAAARGRRGAARRRPLPRLGAAAPQSRRRPRRWPRGRAVLRGGRL